MKDIKSNLWKLVVIWLGFFLFHLIDFGAKRMTNIFQSDAGIPLYPVFIYFLFSSHMELDFTLPRLGSFKAYLRQSSKYLLQEFLPQVLIMGIGCILLSFPLNIPIEWLGAMHFLAWLIIEASFLGMFEQILHLSERAKIGTMVMWIWIIACIIIPPSAINLFTWPTTIVTEISSEVYISRGVQTILIYMLVLIITFVIVKALSTVRKNCWRV